jgi:hypothetical protein
VTAHPVDDHDPDDPDDPVKILAVLPGAYHAQFLAEYTAAVEGARRPEQFRQLQELLRLWRLRAVAYSSPGYEERLAAACHGRAAGSSARTARSGSSHTNIHFEVCARHLIEFYLADPGLRVSTS